MGFKVDWQVHFIYFDTGIISFMVGKLYASQVFKRILFSDVLIHIYREKKSNIRNKDEEN